MKWLTARSKERTTLDGIVLVATGVAMIMVPVDLIAFEECMESGKDPVMIQQYVVRLLLEFGRPMPIKGFVCVDEDKANELLGKTSI
jgi:hypothetical protein